MPLFHFTKLHGFARFFIDSLLHSAYLTQEYMYYDQYSCHHREESHIILLSDLDQAGMVMILSVTDN